MSKPLDFLEELASDQPELASDISQLASLYQKKLWHQLSLKLEAIFALPAFNKGDLTLRMYNHFISDFASKINLLKLAQFAVHTSKYQPSAKDSISFLEGVVVKLEEMKLARSPEPILFIKMHIAQHHLESGSVSDTKKLVEEGKKSLDEISDADPSVSAAVYYVSSLYFKVISDYAEFYKSSLMYLSFIVSDSLQADFKLRLAVDVSLAALLGEQIYSFGQLLQHPIVNVLVGPEYGWLHELLQAFNNGDMHTYDTLCVKYATQLNGQPALVEHERRLREKITIMCLMDMISSLPAEQRRIALTDIAVRTKLEADGVEFLLMKALSLHLIEGIIDQVEGYVQVSWVQPRILTKPQIQGLKERLDVWISKVASISDTLEQEAVGVVEVA